MCGVSARSPTSLPPQRTIGLQGGHMPLEFSSTMPTRLRFLSHAQVLQQRLPRDLGDCLAVQWLPHRVETSPALLLFYPALLALHTHHPHCRLSQQSPLLFSPKMPEGTMKALYYSAVCLIAYSLQLCGHHIPSNLICVQLQKFDIRDVPIPKCRDDNLLLKGTVPVF